MQIATTQPANHRKAQAVLHYFSQSHQEPITVPSLSRQPGISLFHIETAFDVDKGKTNTHQALLDYRLNRLCDLVFKDPPEATSLDVVGLDAQESVLLTRFHRPI